MMISKGYVTNPKGNIFYTMFATPENLYKRPLVCINGGPGFSHDHCIPLAHALAIDRPIILYNQLGCGKSDPIALKDATFQYFVNELSCLQKHFSYLGFSQWYVLGHSWGGAVAAQYASDYPEKVKALILSSPLIETKQWEQDARTLLKTMPESIQKTISLHEAAGTLDSAECEKAAQFFQNSFLWHNGALPEFTGTFNSDLYRALWGPYEFHPTGSLKDLSLWKDLRSLSMPILLCYGQFDWVLPETAQRITQAKQVMFENCAHLSFMENQELYVQTIKEFLNQVRE